MLSSDIRSLAPMAHHCHTRQVWEHKDHRCANWGPGNSLQVGDQFGAQPFYCHAIVMQTFVALPEGHSASNFQ